MCDSVTSSYTSCRRRFIVCGYAASSYADRVYTGLLCMSCCKKLHSSCRLRFIVLDSLSVTSDYTHQVCAGVVLQTFPLADLPPPEGLQHCRSPPGRSATLQTFPHGSRFARLQIFPFHCRSSPGEGLQCCRPFPIFVNSHFGMYEKKTFLSMI